MRNEQMAVLASLRRAQQFLDAHADVLAPVNASTRKQLDAVTSQLADLAVAQDFGSRSARGETARQRALRTALRRTYMAPVAELAKLCLRDVPEFAALKLPPWDVSVGNEVAAAFAMADAARGHLDIFIANGLPPTFADDLLNAATAVRASIAERDTHQVRRVGATAGLAAAEKRGRATLKVLNALILAHAGDNAGLLAEWSAARVVRRKPGPATSNPASDAKGSGPTSRGTGPRS